MSLRPFAALLAIVAAGCGYQVGFGAERNWGIRTVAVHTVQNDTFRQGLDALLTRSLGRDLPQDTGLVPGSPDGADATLLVRLREVSGRSISEIGGGQVREGAILLAAEVRLVARGSGETLYTNRHTDWAEFRSPVGEGLSSALEESAADLSRKILTAIDRSFVAR